MLITEHRLGFTNINAGIDISNIKDNKNQVLLLPEDPNKSAIDLSKKISNLLNINIEIIIKCYKVTCITMHFMCLFP